MRTVILGTADWNQPIATNQHYVANALCKHGEVDFVESIGLRRPEFSSRDVKRIFGRLVGPRPSGVVRVVPRGLSVRSPKVIPIHNRLTSEFNRRILFDLVPANPSHAKQVLWTYSPVTYGLETKFDATVYHCVDLLGKFDGISEKLIETSERRLAAAGIPAIASSPEVANHLRRMGFTDVTLWPNVADVATVERGISPASARTPSAVFAGNLTSKKVDFDLLMRVQRSGVQVELAGPVAQGGGDADESLRRLVAEGANYHGLLSLEGLAQLYWKSSVGLIPYRFNQYTLGVSPLKTFEYLAAGLQVVSTFLPAVVPIDIHVKVSASPDEFVRDVKLGAQESPTPELIADRLAIARENSWASRELEIAAYLDKLDAL